MVHFDHQSVRKELEKLFVLNQQMACFKMFKD